MLSNPIINEKKDTEHEKKRARNSKKAGRKKGAKKPKIGCTVCGQFACTDCVQEPRDIFLVVDGSASIGGENFQKVRKFLVDFVSSIDISPGSNHLGILQFSDKRNIKIELKLDHSQSQTAILRKIEKLKYQGGSDTRTDLGLKKVLEKIFTGSGGDRKNVKDLLIVFTDGNSRDKELTIKYANELKQKMVRILAIGAGPKRFKFKDELQNIASSPQDVMMVDFNSLHRAVKTIVGEICPSTSNLTPPTTSVVSTTTPGKGSAALTTTAAPTTTTAPTSIPKPSVCVSSAPKNILFVVDSSAGYNRYLPETRRRLNEVKILVEKIISGLKLDRFKVGIMQFGGRHNPRMVVEFYQGDNMVDVLSRLKSIEPWYGLQRKTGEALTMASYKLYEVTTSHERHNAQNIIVLITSGLASDQDHAKSELKMLEWRNVRVITVGVGSYPQYLMNYLKPLATVNDLFLVKYNQLRNTANNILDSICSNGRIAPGKKHPGAECGKKPYDIFFLMDGSSSINYKNFDKIRKFTMDLLILLKTMASDINIGFMQFSEQSKTKLLLKLGGHQKKTELELIQTMKYQSGKRTMAGDALSRVNNEVFTGQQGDRSNVDDILFFLTDGNAHDYLKARKMARIMKEKGVRVVTIGAGASVSVDKLREIASGPDFSMSVNFSDLPGLAEKVISRVCGAL